jgi:hypothetical protein
MAKMLELLIGKRIFSHKWFEMPILVALIAHQYASSAGARQDKVFIPSHCT